MVERRGLPTLAGRRVLVIGGSGGLGATSADHLARAGAALTLTGRDRERLEAVAQRVGASSTVADLTNEEDVAALADRLVEFDAVVYAAGVNLDSGLGPLSVQEIEATLQVNLCVPILLASRFAADRIAAAEPGALVLIGSFSGLIASPGTRLYNTSKFGLRGFALALAQDLAGTEVTATIVSPGFVADVGMFAASGTQVPRTARQVSPDAVGAATVSAIARGPAEILVGPVEMRVAARLSAAVPRFSAWVQRRLVSTGAVVKASASGGGAP